MRNIYMFSVFIILIVNLKINYLHGASLNGSDLNYFPSQLHRTIRQTNIEECAPPTIENGKINILKKKSNNKKNFLSLNITCDHNYVLLPPDDYLMSCFNGFWDVDETPECKRCIKRSINTEIDDNFDPQLICPSESLTERSIFRDCGHRIDKTHQPFVVNGTLTKFAEFPWHVAIYKKDPLDTDPKYHCGGSIINEKSILSVAHCFSDAYGKSISSRDYYAAAGKYHRNYNSDSQTTQKRQIVRTDLHPRYQGEFTNYAWDIAVVTVDEPFVISTIVHPVCIDWKNAFDNEHLSPDKYGEVAGWGKTEINLNGASLELRVLKVPFIKAQQCNSLVPSTFIRYITHDKFCAGYTNGSSVCDGDSGGGLVFEREEEGVTKNYIRGLVSVGLQNQGRCDDYKYSTYTKVSEYIPFIRECIQNKNISTTLLSVSPPTTTEQTVSTESSTEADDNCITPNNVEAKCISIYDCKIFVTALKNYPTLEVINFMKASICGKANERKVCCGSTVNYLSAIEAPPATTKPIKHNKLDILPPPGVCGRQTRVGQDRKYTSFAEILDHPWIALLEFGTAENSAGFLCSGALINERYVLTAAHCAARTRSLDSGRLFRVRLGEYDIHSEIDCVNSTRRTGLLPNGRTCADPPININIESIIAHPEYNNRKKINDIALLRLAQKVTFTDFIKPICLPLHGETSLPGKQMVVVQWNEIGFSNSVKENSFVTILSETDCARRLERIRRVELESSNICASTEHEKDDCKVGGDSGGPLMTTLVNSSDVYIEGIISYSGSCGAQLPIVATKVTSFINWILAIIEP